MRGELLGHMLAIEQPIDRWGRSKDRRLREAGGYRDPESLARSCASTARCAFKMFGIP
jgi:hypothetical protein